MGAVVSFVAMAVAGREIQRRDEHLRADALPLGDRLRRGLARDLAQRPRLRPGPQPAPWLHVKRNLFHYTGQNLWFYRGGD